MIFQRHFVSIYNAKSFVLATFLHRNNPSFFTFPFNSFTKSLPPCTRPLKTFRVDILTRFQWSRAYIWSPLREQRKKWNKSNIIPKTSLLILALIMGIVPNMYIRRFPISCQKTKICVNKQNSWAFLNITEQTKWSYVHFPDSCDHLTLKFCSQKRIKFSATLKPPWKSSCSSESKTAVKL